jgi:hypothetical protein
MTPKINHDWPEFTGFAWGPSGGQARRKPERFFWGWVEIFTKHQQSIDEEVDFTNVHLL